MSLVSELVDRFRSLLSELAKFGTVGFLSLLVDVLVYNAVLYVNDDKPLTARVLATVVPPPLTEVASKKAIKARRTTTVAFKVTDGGRGVKGAKVAGGGKTCTTSAKGVCSLALTPKNPGKLKVTAKKRGYGTVTFVLKVKR